MNNRLLAILGITILFIGIFIFFNTHGSKISQITIDTHTFSVTLARTDAEKNQGLSGKQSLQKNSGMLFLFSSPDYYSFWMKDMKFPLDIIYIQNNKIVTIFQNVPAPSSQNLQAQLPIYKPTVPADRVLEINAGLANIYNFHVGDTVIFKV